MSVVSIQAQGGYAMKTIDGSFRENVLKYPDRTALRYYQDQNWEQISYSELSASVNITAAGLMETGAGNESKIAIMSENRPEWIVCYLAIAYTGAVVVPIDALLGETETEHILNHSGADTIACSMKCFDVISRILVNLPSLKNLIIFDRNIIIRHDHRGYGDGKYVADKGSKSNKHKRFLSYEELRDLGRRRIEKGEIVFPEKDVKDIASIIYTSGTTGTPKGVMLSHFNFMSNFVAIMHAITVDHTDNILLLLPLHHVFPFTCCFVLPLSLGASISFVDILSRDRTRLIEECKPTLLVGVPLLFSKIYRGIIRQVEASKIKNFIFRFGGKKIIGIGLKKKLGGALRYMISGAAPMEPAIIEGFVSLGIQFIEGYGLTETSPVCSVNPIGKIKIGSVGKPLYGVQVKIIDPGSDGIGEIAVKGDNIMRGYYKNPEQTAVVIRDGWFYTGDLGYVDKDGYIFITGRAKDVIVNRGGKNVYPEVVEAEINLSKYIAESVVIGYKTEGRVGEDVGLLLYPDYEALIELSVKNGVTFNEHMNAAELTEDAKDELIGKYRTLLEEEVKKSMERLAPYQRVSRIAIERDEFIKTSTRKIKRFLYKGRLDILDLR